MLMSDLPEELVEEIVSRVPISSLGAVRSTCKRWNNLSKDRILCKAEIKQQFLGFMLKEYKVCSMRFDLNGIHNEDVELSIKEIGRFDQLKISQILHCDGLVLLVTLEAYSRLVVWNPYLRQTMWIKPSNNCHLLDRFALGYDNNRNHKILRYLETENCEIYDCKSKSWRILDVIPESGLKFCKNNQSVSVKGNTYFFVRGKQIGEAGLDETFLLCFDFTRERFGSCLHLPFHVGRYDKVALHSIREEQLAVLFNHFGTSEMEIWVTTKIEPNAVSWRNLFTVAMTHFDELQLFTGSFFIDQEKKLAVLFDMRFSKEDHFRDIAYIIGETGYLRTVDLGKAVPYRHLTVCSYTPRLVQINQDQELSHFGQKKRWRLPTCHVILKSFAACIEDLLNWFVVDLNEISFTDHY